MHITHAIPRTSVFANAVRLLRKKVNKWKLKDELID